MIFIADAFDVESTKAYSGSTFAEIMQGNLLDPTFTASMTSSFSPIIAVSTLGRVRIGDHTSGSSYLKNAKNSNEIMITSEFYNHKRKYNIGYNHKFSYQYCNNEIFYDSVVPNMFQILRLNGAKYIWSAFEGLNDPYLWMGNHLKFIIGYPDMVLTSSTTSSLLPTLNAQISDNTWAYSFPFQQRYSTVRRAVNYPPITATTEYSESLPKNSFGSFTGNQVYYGPDPTPHFADPNFVSIEFVSLSSSGDTIFTSDRYTYRTLTEHYVTVSFSNNVFITSSFLLSQDHAIYPAATMLYKHFFGFGDGFRNQVLFENLSGTIATDPSSKTYLYGQGGLVRGWKYGLYNAFLSSTKMVSSRKRYGQLRDVLEQRKYTKFFDPIGINDNGILGSAIGSKQSAVEVSFISGTQSYITASNIALDTRETGFYNYEAAVSVPFIEN